MPTDLSSLYILVIDPDRTMVALMRDVLKTIGIVRVDTIPDADRALAELRSNRYDIVITERDMAPLNGIALTKMIRTGENSARRMLPS